LEEDDGIAKKLLVTEKALKEITCKYVALENKLGNLKAACNKMQNEKTKADLSLNTQVKFLISKLNKTKSKLIESSGKKSVDESVESIKDKFYRSQSKELSASKYCLDDIMSSKKHVLGKGEYKAMRLKEPGTRVMRNLNMNATYIPQSMKYKNHY